MQPTPYPDINRHLDTLLQAMQAVLGENLVGLYLFGSLVTGDFNPETSDIDLLAVTESGINDREFEQLDRMHLDFIARNPEWHNRLEVAYLSTSALKTYRWQTSNIGIISPGEPFHIKEAGYDWLINWYNVLTKGVSLFGPPPEAVIDPISKEEFIQAVAHQAEDWRDWVYNMRTRPGQAYAIQTICRALYSYRTGEQASKKQAALWAQQELPQWSHFIGDALRWRRTWNAETAEDAATFPETVRFVHFVIDLITGGKRTDTGGR